MATDYHMVLCHYPKGWWPLMVVKPDVEGRDKQSATDFVKREFKNQEYRTAVVSTKLAVHSDSLLELARRIAARSESGDPRDHYSDTFEPDLDQLRALIREIDNPA